MRAGSPAWLAPDPRAVPAATEASPDLKVSNAKPVIGGWTLAGLAACSGDGKAVDPWLIDLFGGYEGGI